MVLSNHTQRPTRRPTGGSPRGRGFTLLETSLALIIIGVGVLAFVEAQRSFAANNQWSSHTARAMYLANEVREMCRRFPRHDPVTGLYFETVNNDTVLRGWGMESGESGAEDFDDIDDLDGASFGDSGIYDGPIDSYGLLIHETDVQGEEAVDEEGNALGLTGWSQSVIVEKVDPFNFSTVREHTFKEEAQGSFPGRAVDKYPLRVTVTVLYRGPLETSAQEIASVSWIVP
ncbi:MAG: prepilin-type N-terminal cleavage/methylation domain-containing protein [Phycisphaerales bacterium]|nr:prepilin-type N-terminal cleavage/methylation domain-containing protein [Phycisphaerales bacterium]